MDAATIRANADRVRDRISEAGGDPASVRLVAVTKAHPAATVRAALDAGLVDLGENYAQELVAKASDLETHTEVEVEAEAGLEVEVEVEVEVEPRWHFIGQLQRNKVRQIAPLVHLWQSVDRLRLGEDIARRQPGASVLVQVNLTDAPGRGGTKPGLTAGLVDGLRDLGLDVRGLMAVAPEGDEATARAAFQVVRELADRLSLAERSIGMSEDLEAAVKEGSTMVRVGSALFGARPRLAS
jgi:pyridoxal phosphate enzyme (YggS family)